MVEGPLSSGFTPGELSEKIRPQDDLFRYVNEVWMQRTPIPADKASYGTFSILDEKSERAIRVIVEEAQSAQGGEARKFGDLYTSFLNEELVEALGAQPLRAPLERVAAVTSIGELLQVVGELQRSGIPGLF